MSAPLWTKFSKDEIISMLNDSNSISNLIEKLGYHTRSYQTQKQVYKMLDFYNLQLPDYDSQREVNFKQERICAICGNTFIVENFEQAKRKYCFECSPSTNNPVSKIAAMRAKVIAMKGGRCERCGYDKCQDALEFHHLDPLTKDIKLANNGAAPSFEKFLAESEKCILLCANCHREEHWRLRQESKAGN